MHASTIHVIVTGVHYKAPKQQPMPCILCRVKGWYFEGWGGSKMVSCASRPPQLAVLFCFASNCPEISTSGLPPLSIWLPAAHPCAGRKGFTFCIVRQMSRFSQVWYSQLSVVCKTLNWAAFLITFYGCDWKGFDKRGSFMFDLFALLLSFLTGTKNKILSKHEPKKHIVHFLYTLLLVFNCCKSDSCFHDWWINHNLIGRPANTQQLIQGGFFNWSPPKKYVKPRLGESTLT